MISAHLMCVNNQFDDAAADRIVELFDLHWAPSALCKQFPKNDPVADATERVGKALPKGMGSYGKLATMQSLRCMPSRRFAMGDVEWAESCRTAFRKYVTVTLF